MRLPALVVCIVCGAVLAIPASRTVFAQGQGTCSSPYEFGGTGHDEFTFDTQKLSNNENNACVDSLATGPDVVILSRGCVKGDLSWRADFDAVVYLRRFTCEDRCEDWSTDGTIFIDGNWRWVWTPHPHVVCDDVYIIVDGLNGSAGTITLNFDYDYDTPVFTETWGQLKSRYD
jgi:hypothetical protein